MTRHTAIVTLFAIAATGMAMAEEPPERVVSLDFCADQYLLKMLPRSRILALSPDAGKDFSYMRAHADGIATVRPIAEDVLTIKPDLVVRSYGGGPHVSVFFERAGVEVLQLPYANNLQEIREMILFVANGLGVPERGAKIVANMDERLASLADGNGRKALYMTPTGVTSGPGTVIHEMLLAARLGNFQQSPGWRSLPLERLAYEQPDLIAAAFFDADTNHPAQWSAMRHPVAKRQMLEQPTVMLRGAWTACGGWFLVDAIEALADIPE